MTSKDIFRYPALFLYYTIGRFLPHSIPFSIGKRTRRFLCRSIFDELGDTSSVGTNAYFGLGKGIKIGAKSAIGERAYITGMDGSSELIIGNHVLMAPEVSILTHFHHYEKPDIPICYQGHSASKVIIEDDVWIAYRVIILPGVTIGKGSVVAAGAVVTKDIPPYSVAGGVPARVLKWRKKPSTCTQNNLSD